MKYVIKHNIYREIFENMQCRGVKLVSHRACYEMFRIKYSYLSLLFQVIVFHIYYF